MFADGCPDEQEHPMVVEAGMGVGPQSKHHYLCATEHPQQLDDSSQNIHLLSRSASCTLLERTGDVSALTGTRLIHISAQWLIRVALACTGLGWVSQSVKELEWLIPIRRRRICDWAGCYEANHTVKR